MRDYLELTKPNVTWLILMSTGVGFYVGAVHPFSSLVLLVNVLIGTALVASGTAALNQWMERDVDGKMRRTQNRPLPARRLDAGRALLFGLVLSAAGTAYLVLTVNWLTGFLGAFTCSSYLLLYTPLKRHSTLSTFVGAFPGAMPILMGYAAATGRLTLQGWVLYGILFLWQFPHFLSIATLYREDYERGGIVMLPVVEPEGTSTRRQIVAYTIALLLLSAVPTILGFSGSVYLFGTLALGIAFLYFGIGMRTRLQARRLLQASVVYLPLVYGLMIFDKQ